MGWRLLQFLQVLSLLALLAWGVLTGLGQPLSVPVGGVRLPLWLLLPLALLLGAAWGGLLMAPTLLWLRERQRRERDRARALERTLNATLQARLAESAAGAAPWEAFAPAPDPKETP